MKVLIFGASGNLGRNLTRKLVKNNYKIKAYTRSTHTRGNRLKVLGPIGYIEIVEGSIFDLNKIDILTKEADVVVNLVGVLNEKNKANSFENIHIKFPYALSELCAKNNVSQLVHLSALNIENIHDSKYATSKFEGEKAIKKNFKNSTIIKPSICAGPDDNFTNLFFRLLKLFPIFPLFHGGKTKFQVVYVGDVTEVILKVIKDKIFSETIECVGPKIYTFAEIIKILCKQINKKRLLIPLPDFLGRYSSLLLSKFPGSLITYDQYKLLRYDNILTNKFNTNTDIGVKCSTDFNELLSRYSYLYREGGQYSK